MTVKTYRVGMHRSSRPEETRARIWPLLRPLGITRVANITGLDCIGIPVMAAYRPNARSLSVAQGKGCSAVAAEVSAAMESIEFHHAEHVTRPLVVGSWNQLRFSLPLLPIDLLPRSAVGRFHPDLKIHWIEGYDLGRDEPCTVPYEMVHTDFTLPLPAGSGCFPMTSNGLASGNHLHEAISHALAELVERDAETLFSLLSESGQNERRVRPETINAEECRSLLSRFRAAGVDVAIWDLTSDIGVATFRVVIMDRELDPARPLRPNTGSGCHPSRSVALARALTEAAQSRLTIIASSRDDLPRERYREAADLERLAELREQSFQGAPVRSFDLTPTFEAESIEEDVLWQRERLTARGLDRLVVVDLTKPELGIPVARVIVPGLESSRQVPGWIPGARARAVIAGGCA